ncbi:Fc.00g088180.m01.CDS01 [Cosmosporella sp. VM-42]
MADKNPKQYDLIERGVKKSNPPGTLAFLGLRSLDTILQYNLLAGGGAVLLARAGITTVATGAALQTGINVIDSLDLPLSHLIILAMAVGSTLKQSYWLVSLSQENFPPIAAVAVSGYNTLVNTANTLLFLAATTSSLSAPAFPGTDVPYPLVIGSILYTIGITLETLSEYQRRKFKDDPASKGKVMRTGLWRWARHINYGGYALWRGAYCMASTGIFGGLIMGTFQAFDFVTRAVPVLNDYCEKKYGEQWESFKKDVKWTILPGIY